MHVILSIFVIAVIILLVFGLCAFALQAARAALPKYEKPPTTYSYQVDGEHGDIERRVAKPASASGDPGQHIWVINYPPATTPAGSSEGHHRNLDDDEPTAADGGVRRR